jgi:prepilin-type N-terminal cleavage/methylation domain-containing protein
MQLIPARPFNILTASRGFTLIEALVALAVLTIGILTMYTMQTGSIRGNYRAARITTAASWAADRMEQFNAMAYDDPRLMDVQNDGTDQDDNGNGIDDDDEGIRVDDIANFGLDSNSASTADYTVSGELDGFTMYYNVAVDQPVAQMKTIRIIIVRDLDRQSLVFDYYKAASL